MELGNLIGKGSDGLVYQLLNNGKISDKVIKFIRLSNYGINNYLENYILLNLKHQNLANAISILLDNANLLKIVQYRADSDLRRFIYTTMSKTCKKNEKFEIMRQISEGLSFLHSRNILHGDIKPDNILKFKNIYKLSDFGYARILEEGENFGKIEPDGLYTIIYRPPELKLGLFCLKSDLWALGCTFYEIFYKKAYFNLLISNQLFHPDQNITDRTRLDKFDNLINSLITNNIFARKDIDYVLNFFSTSPEESTEKIKKQHLVMNEKELFLSIGVHKKLHKKLFTKKLIIIYTEK